MISQHAHDSSRTDDRDRDRVHNTCPLVGRLTNAVTGISPNYEIRSAAPAAGAWPVPDTWPLANYQFRILSPRSARLAVLRLDHDRTYYF